MPRAILLFLEDEKNSNYTNEEHLVEQLGSVEAPPSLRCLRLLMRLAQAPGKLGSRHAVPLPPQKIKHLNNRRNSIQRLHTTFLMVNIVASFYLFDGVAEQGGQLPT